MATLSARVLLLMVLAQYEAQNAHSSNQKKWLMLEWPCWAAW